MPGFDPGLMLELIETYRGTITLAVPTMLWPCWSIPISRTGT